MLIYLCILTYHQMAQLHTVFLLPRPGDDGVLQLGAYASRNPVLLETTPSDSIFDCDPSACVRACVHAGMPTVPTCRCARRVLAREHVSVYNSPLRVRLMASSGAYARLDGRTLCIVLSLI